LLCIKFLSPKTDVFKRDNLDTLNRSGLVSASVY